MKLCLINGSHRVKSQSLRITNYISEMDVVKNASSSLSRIDLINAEIPVWDEGVWDETEEWNGWFTISQETIEEADAFVIVTPEYGGMVPPLLKNLLLLCSVNETGHKPALIVAVSAGTGGFAPMTELRSFAYKNNHLCFIPDHVILRNVEELFIQSEPSEHEQELIGRLTYGVELLSAYSEALKRVRKSGVINTGKYKYGMS